MEHPMTRQTTALALALCLGMMSATTTLAQDSTAPAPAAPEAAPATPGAAPAAEAPAVSTTTDLSLGAPAAPAAPAPDGPGTTYVPATFEAWEQRCIRTEDGSDPCQLYQLLKDATGRPLAEVSMVGMPAGQAAAVGATIVVPLGTLLTEALSIGIDAAPAKRYPFTVCGSIGCVARVGFTAEELAALKAGAKATLTIVPFESPDQKVVLDMSLKGFTAGFTAVNEANAK
jgi:invasion protein IalB